MADNNFVINDFDKNIIDILLIDRTTRKNILWATDTYAKYGKGYRNNDHILTKCILGSDGCIIKPRNKKPKEEQQLRIKNKAEVFTPSWVCNKQNNLLDKSWFEKENVFNKEIKEGWITNKNKIAFPSNNNKTWEEYVKLNRLEIACGEAPYLVSRYDSISGEAIPLEDRIGLLDRKLRVINENVNDKNTWYEWVKKAFKSTYGFDWQGDNVFIARENLLYSFTEYYTFKFNLIPDSEKIMEIADILSWNIWQMDALKFVIPNSCKSKPKEQLSLFENNETTMEECEGCLTNNPNKHTGIYCKIMDWQENKPIRFVTILGRKING